MLSLDSWIQIELRPTLKIFVPTLYEPAWPRPGAHRYRSEATDIDYDAIELGLHRPGRSLHHEYLERVMPGFSEGVVKLSASALTRNGTR